VNNDEILEEILDRIKRIEKEIYGNGNPEVSIRVAIAELKTKISHIAGTNKWQTIGIISIIIFLLSLLGVDKIPAIF